MTALVRSQTLSSDIASLSPQRVTNLQRFWWAYRRNRIAMLGLVIVITLVLAAVLAPFIAPYDPIAPHYTQVLAPPGNEFLLGTDELGRDIFSRLLYGAGISLVIGFSAQIVAIGIGIVLGMVSGWYGGRIDDLIMRTADAFFAIPSLMFLIVWVAILQPSKESIFIALGLIGWPGDARMMRSQVLAVKNLEYVVAAQAMGASTVRIMLQHLLPNAIAPSIVLATLGIAGAILVESSLSFLGLGVQIPNPSWGSMINLGRNYTTTAWWYALYPGLAIVLTTLSFNFVGDGLRDALDPMQYR
jgi:peptide/nickel transport system permease protein